MESLPSYYLPGKTLGKGAYATVIEAVDKRTNQVVAVKLIKKTPSSLTKHAEYQALKAMHSPRAHPNAVLPIAFYETETSSCIVMKLVSGGDLYSRVEPNGPGLTKSQAKRWMKQLCNVVYALHKVDYVHADIKPENCLIDADENLLLGDFGLAVPIGHVHRIRVPGTEAYMAPEMLARSREGVVMTPAVDVFSLGITLYAMLFADLPWDAAHTKDRDFREFLKTQKLNAPGNAMSLLTTELYKLMVRMLHPDPSLRATMEEIVNFFNSKQPWFLSKPATAAPVKAPRISLPDIQSLTTKPISAKPVNTYQHYQASPAMKF